MQNVPVDQYIILQDCHIKKKVSVYCISALKHNDKHTSASKCKQLKQMACSNGFVQNSTDSILVTALKCLYKISRVKNSIVCCHYTIVTPCSSLFRVVAIYMNLSRSLSDSHALALTYAHNREDQSIHCTIIDSEVSVSMRHTFKL